VNCFNRTYIGACATIGANFGINFVDITFRDSFHRTFIDAGSASGAIIINFISHDLLILCPALAERVNNFHGKDKTFPEIITGTELFIFSQKVAFKHHLGGR
jgi:hypothetical protein